jgi:4'-phosphopantetheinyl transferase EntD
LELGSALPDRDRDQAYRAAVTRRLRTMGIRESPSRRARLGKPALPERLIGSIRRESVDHIGMLGEAHLCMPDK